MEKRAKDVNKKLIGINAILNTIRTFVTIAFPLITYPYVTRILNVNNLGKYNFSSSIVSYFLLLSGLGISTYAVREGAKYRGNKDAMSKFCSEMLVINIISTIVSYILLLCVLVLIPKLIEYRIVIIIISIGIGLTTIGCDWIFTIYEDFLYITVRSIFFQIIALICMFIFVQDEKDLYQYAFIVLISNYVPYLFNAITIHKYIRFVKVSLAECKKHLRPILILFANSAMTTIYVSSDTIILGFLTNDYYTGIYSVSVKIYSVVKQLLAAIIIVSVPSLSLMYSTNKKKFDCLASEIFNMLLLIILPAMTGVIMLSKEIVDIIAGNNFYTASVSQKLLGIALIFSLIAWFYTSCVLVPAKKENKVLCATIVAAIANIILNFILIPIFQERAAAFTTIIAEMISMLMCIFWGKKEVNIKILKRDLFSVCLGCVFIILICKAVISILNSAFLTIIFSVFMCIAAYGIILLVMKNSILMKIVNTAKCRKYFDELN